MRFGDGVDWKIQIIIVTCRERGEVGEYNDRPGLHVRMVLTYEGRAYWLIEKAARSG